MIKKEFLIFRNKKGLGQALLLLLSILLISIQLIIFYMFFFDRFVNPTTFAIREVPNTIDNNQFLLNLLKTPYNNDTIPDLIKISYANNDYKELKEKINSFIIKYYGDNRFWELKIGEKSVNNFAIIEPIIRDKEYESSTILPLYSKEAVEIVLSVYE